jgi:transmembrane sensor
MKQRETSAEIDAAAADWAARIDAAQSDEAVQSGLNDWLTGDSRRLGAYARARAMMVHAGRLKAFGTDFDPDLYIAEHRGAAAIGREVESQPETPRIGRRSFLIGGGAVIAAGAAGLSWQAAASTYSTTRGEIRLVPLIDGSSMTLNTASTARVRFTDTMRHVELIDGEALFDVVRDSARPFVVDAADTNVRAVDTSFVIRRLARQAVAVTVRQGSVDINRSGSGRVSSHRVFANMRAVSPASTADIVTSAVTPSDVTRELAWREGMLSFEDMPLRNAADQFARYSGRQIVFADPSIGDETVTGLFAANDPAGFARSVALSLDLKADAGAGAVVLRR